jgi:hypothetical protein
MRSTVALRAGLGMVAIYCLGGSVGISILEEDWTRSALSTFIAAAIGYLRVADIRDQIGRNR